MKVTLGRVLTAFGIAAALALAVWSLMPKPVPVETATVTSGRFVATVDEDGKTRVRERYGGRALGRSSDPRPAEGRR
jgi:HlyD family secretion protein